MSGTDIAATKAALRQCLQAARRAHVKKLGPDGMAAASTAALRHLLALAVFEQPAIVAGYWPLPGEFDSRPLLAALHARGHTITLPVVVGAGQALRFRQWWPGMALLSDRFDVRVPPLSSASMRPQILLVPLTAIDGAGYRLGYGGGFYDRTLAALANVGPVTAIGLGFSMQEVDKLPIGAYDRALDWLVTERASCKFERDRKA